MTRKPKFAVVIDLPSAAAARREAATAAMPVSPDAVEASGQQEAVSRRRGRPRHGKAFARELPRDEELLKIAADVMYRKGFDGARLSDIAKEAGIVKGSLYHYFGSKQELFERLVRNVRGPVDFEREIRGPGTPRQRLTHLLRVRLETTVEYPLEVGILVRELSRMGGAGGEYAREDPKRYFVAIRQIILQGQKCGEFRPCDPDILALMIHGILAHLPNWYRLGSRIRPDALVDEMIDYIMAGLLVDPNAPCEPL